MNWEMVTVGILGLVAGIYYVQLLRVVWYVPHDRYQTRTETSAEFAAVIPSDHSDRDYGILWRTQAITLRKLATNGKSGIPNDAMCQMFNDFARRYPELCEGFSADNWLRWMESEELITRSEKAVILTEKGRFLLEDLERNYLPVP